MIIYGAAPFVVGGLWLRNQRTDPKRPEPGEPIVSAGVRLAARTVAVALGAAALALLLWPSLAVDHGPWALTPATTRALAGYAAQVAFGALLVSREERWGSWRILLQAFLVATALLLVGVARAWDEIETGRASAWIFLVGLAGMALAIVALYRRWRSAQCSALAESRLGSARTRTGGAAPAHSGSHQLRSPSSVIVGGHEDEPHERRVEGDRDRAAERDHPGSPGSPSR